MSMTMPRPFYFLAMVLLLTGCSDNLPGWMGGDPPEVVRVPGERFEVLASENLLTPDASVAEVPVDIPDAVKNTDWLSLNQGAQSGSLALTGLEDHASATIGEGNDFTHGDAIRPIAAAGTVFAMDAAGYVSAHDAANLDHKRFVSDAAVEEDEPELLGGGLASAAGVLSAATG